MPLAQVRCCLMLPSIVRYCLTLMFCQAGRKPASRMLSIACMHMSGETHQECNLRLQEAESLLQDFWRQVKCILKALQGTVEIAAPAAPLAMTCLLGCITPGSTCSLQTCPNPVIQVCRFACHLWQETPLPSVCNIACHPGQMCAFPSTQAAAGGCCLGVCTAVLQRM